MAKIRVLVVDDSAVARRVLTEVLSADPGVEVVGTASQGEIALPKIEQLNPDLVTLDIEMPGIGGLETLVQLRRRHPHLPVVMFSAVTERAAAITLEALARGANDYVTKPSHAASREAALEHVRTNLLPKIHALCGRRRAGEPASASERRAAVPLRTHSATTAARVEILAVGASTGGPAALVTFFSAFPVDCPVPIVVVQHMPPVFTKLFAAQLTTKSAIPFSEVKGGEILEPGRGYLAPGDFHMRVALEAGRARIKLDQGARENSCRPAVDVLFRSVAEAFGASTLAVVLTGMGQDGLRGCEEVRQRNGQIVVQDEESSVVWGMPGFVARAGLADAVVPLREIAQSVLRRLGRRLPQSLVHAG